MFRLCHRLFSSVPRFANLFSLWHDRAAIRASLENLKFPMEMSRRAGILTDLSRVLTLLSPTHNISWWITVWNNLGGPSCPSYISLSWLKMWESPLIPQRSYQICKGKVSDLGTINICGPKVCLFVCLKLCGAVLCTVGRLPTSLTSTD